MPLTGMDNGDANDLLFELKREHGLSEGTLRNYRKALRYPFRHLGHDWADNGHVGASPSDTREVDPSEILTDGEVDAMFGAARNSRDRALIALLLDTGLRIGAVASLRVRDVELTEKAGTITLNQDGPTKDSRGTVPITWSRSHVVNWLSNHPRRDEPDAALIHELSPLDEHVGDGALRTSVIRRRLKRLADDADIDRDRINPHTWRKTAIANWTLEGLSDQQIKHRAG